jgi:hypothetical protein
MVTTFKVEWVDDGRESIAPANPHFPDGIEIDGRRNREAPSCKTDLPYPAARCGHYVIECGKCGLRIVLTTAGRRDDPRSVQMNCKLS